MPEPATWNGVGAADASARKSVTRVKGAFIAGDEAFIKCVTLGKKPARPRALYINDRSGRTSINLVLWLVFDIYRQSWTLAQFVVTQIHLFCPSNVRAVL